MNKRSAYLTTPAQVFEYIESVEFPVDKRKLIETARNHVAPEEVIFTIEQLPDREYKNPVDLGNTIAKLK
jgi:hypothetical protein